MQNEQALSIARNRVRETAALHGLVHGDSPAAVETREVLQTLEQIQTDLATGVLVYAKDAPA